MIEVRSAHAWHGGGSRLRLQPYGPYRRGSYAQTAEASSSMPSPANVLMEALPAMVNRRGLEVLGNVTEGTTTRRLMFELCRGSQISLQPEFGFHLQKDRTVRVTWTIALRWPIAEEMLRDLRPPSPYGPDVLTPQVLEARSTLYPIAQLRVCEDPAYFARPSPARFAPSEFSTMPDLVANVLDILVGRVASEFCSYCDIDELGQVAVEPEAKSRLLMAPMNVAAILVAARKRHEFEAWREAYRNGFVGPRFRGREVNEWHEQYMSSLEGRLPH